MRALEDLYPLLQVDELLGQDVHMAAEADAFLTGVMAVPLRRWRMNS